MMIANIFAKLASSSYVDAGMMSKLIELSFPTMKFDRYDGIL